MTISDLAKFMVESLGKDRAEEILEMLKEEAGKNIPEETQRKLMKMAEIRSEIEECMEEPREIPLELVTRFNQLYNECFPIKEAFDRKKKENAQKQTGEVKVAIVGIGKKGIGKKPNTEPEASKTHDDSYQEGFMAGVNQFGSYMADALDDFEPDPDAEDEE